VCGKNTKFLDVRGEMAKGKINNVTEQIRHILTNDTQGLTIQELSDRVKTSRITTAMALMKLEGQGFLNVRVIGNCKLHYLKQAKGVKGR